MKENLVKILILEMLSIDDEPLNLILAEAIVSEDKRQHTKSPYDKEVISQVDIKDALRELKQNSMVNILDESGKKILCDEIDEVLNSKEEWVYWFSITDSGKKFLEENYFQFFNE